MRQTAAIDATLGMPCQFKKGQNVVFLHNGGSVALYGYMHALKDALAA